MKLTEFAPASAIPLVKIQSEGDVAANPAQLLLRTPHTPPTLRYLTLPFPPQSPPNLSKPPETGGLSQTWTRVSFPSFWGGGAIRIWRVPSHLGFSTTTVWIGYQGQV